MTMKDFWISIYRHKQHCFDYIHSFCQFCAQKVIATGPVSSANILLKLKEHKDKCRKTIKATAVGTLSPQKKQLLHLRKKI